MAMLNIDALTTRQALPFPVLIEALRRMFAAGCEVPRRHVHEVAPPEAAGVSSLIMPAWNARYYGVKIVNIAPGNAARGLAGLHASYLLHDAATGVPLALVDGNEITARRTAAASALAASWLAREDARHLLVLGAGKVARLLPEAYRAVRAIDRVTVWARSPAQATALVGELCNAGIDAAVTADLAASVAAADIVSCATLATSPVVLGQWLAAGSHLDLIGSFTPAMRETDDACFVGASIFVDTEEALQKSGDLLGPMARGVFEAADVKATLAELVAGTKQGRRAPTERTVFKSVGTALEDLAAAVLVYESLRA
ncbi:MAG: ornithine cyclodeaminase [Variovorax sp.]|nr:ornithine cyclodeaminase [Variovorax sp.]